MTDTTNSSLSKVRAVERAMLILRAFGPNTLRLSLAELTRLTELDKATTRRLLHTLAGGDFIQFDDSTKTYALGPGVLLLMPGVQYGNDLRAIAAPALTRLAERTGATAFLWTYFDGFALCLDRVNSPDLHIQSRWSGIGTRVTLNHSGGPRVLLAYLSDSERSNVLSRPLERPTEYTVVDPVVLESAAKEIRERGWEFTVNDFTVGLSGLGVPILDHKGSLVASVSIATLTPQFAISNGQPEHLPLVLKAAAEIAASLRRE